MAKNKGITLALLLVLLLHVDAYALSGVLSKSFYVPVVKGELSAEETVDEATEEPEESEMPATPTNVFVIVSAPIQIEIVDEESSEPEEEIEAVEAPQLDEEIE